ncbi:MAG: PLP-dependent aminotransferase family protein [Chloroflexi bacterium]|nr:PLP-dependent aminotransferase family protein [Chloroflexota bacterium]
METPHTQVKILRYQELADRLAELIRQGTYLPGARIPSVRQMSRQQGVSISTVLQAYLALENSGLIEARPQSGYYVRRRNAERLPEPGISAPEQDARHVSLHELVMMLLRDSVNPDLVQLGAALPNPYLMPVEKINRFLANATRQYGDEAHQYQFPPGLDALRAQIAQRAVIAGCSLTLQDILITSGGVEAIDLCLHVVCRPGDIVAIESPMYFGTLQTLEVHGLRVLEIPTHPREGISLEALAFAMEHHPVRAVIVISNFNNPLGSQIPDEKKKELVEYLARFEIPLIENDVSGEIYFGEKRPIVCKAFDRQGLVMLVSSFSKDISPGLRVGWVAPGRYKTQLEWLKFTISAASPTISQIVVADFMQSGGYDHHLRRIRREYARNVELMSDAVMRYFPEGIRLTRPGGGFVLWVQLPEAVDSLELYRRALAAKITLAPGTVFSATRQYSNFVRLNAAEYSYPIERALEYLGGIVKDMMTGY